MVLALSPAREEVFCTGCPVAETIWSLSFLMGQIQALLRGVPEGTVYSGCYLSPGYLDKKPYSTSVRRYLHST